MVQWLGLPSSAGHAGSIPDQGTKIIRALWPKNKTIKQKQYCNRFNKDFKNGPHQKKPLKQNQNLDREEWSTI